MKSKYETHALPYLDNMRIWIAKGATHKEVADKLHVSVQALYKWKTLHEELKDALESPRGFADDKVEAALFKRATGYDYEEETQWQTIGPGGKIIWLTRKTKKHLPPDPSSIQFWLRNRRPKEWNKPIATEAEDSSDTGVVMLPEVKDE